MTRKQWKIMGLSIVVFSSGTVLAIIVLTILWIFGMMQQAFGTEIPDTAWNQYHLCLAQNDSTDAACEACEQILFEADQAKEEQEEGNYADIHRFQD